MISPSPHRNDKKRYRSPVVGVVLVLAMAVLAVTLSPIWSAFAALIAAMNFVRLVRDMASSSAPTYLPALLIAVNITIILTVLGILIANVAG